MPKNIQKGLLILLALFLLSAPLLGLAAWNPAASLVPSCNSTLGTRADGSYGYTDECNWAYLLALANNILQFLVFLAVPIAAICFAYAGWLYLSAMGNSGQISRAHSIFLNVFIGLVIVLVAWLVVDELFKALVQPGSYAPVLIGGGSNTPSP